MSDIVINNFLTEEEEKELIHEIDAGKWLDNRTKTRRVQISGPFHDQKYRMIPGKFTTHPDYIVKLAQRLFTTLLQIDQVKELVQLNKINDQQMEVYINEFLPKDHLDYHFDHRSTYDELIIGVNLASDSILSFQKGDQILEIPMPQRSVYLMHGAMRNEWKHGIQNGHITSRRLSITFRTIAK